MPKKVTKRDIDRVKEDTKKEEWGKGEPLQDSAKRHLDSVSAKSRKGVRYDRTRVNTNWTKVAPEARLEYVRGNLNDEIEETLEALDRERNSSGVPEPRRKKKKKDKKEDRKKGSAYGKGTKGSKGRRNPKRHGRHGRRGRRKRPRRNRPGQPPVTPGVPPTPLPPEPEIIEDDAEEELIEDPIILIPPVPRPVESPPPPPPPRKTVWDSRIGYFVSLSDVTWYEEVPRVLESPYMDINFDELPEGFLRLGEGESWVSEWYESGVIRGLNVDVLGKHKINYAKNGDFEI